jgi:predicted transcriptional regulator
MQPSNAAKLVERARLDAGLSQRELARRAGTTQAVVARIEGGHASPRWDTLASLLAAAGFELRTRLDPAPVPDSHMLAEVPRILRLSPENRIREVAAVNRFVSSARRIPRRAVRP